MKSVKNITRIDNNNFQGWIIKIQYKGQKCFKQISDRKYGGKKKSFTIAKEILQDFKTELGFDDKTSRRIMRHNPHNVNGLRRGVSRIWNSYGEYFLVTWQDSPGHTRKKVFSINKYGEAEAKKMAVDYRVSKEHEIYGEVIDS